MPCYIVNIQTGEFFSKSPTQPWTPYKVKAVAFPCKENAEAAVTRFDSKFDRILKIVSN